MSERRRRFEKVEKRRTASAPAASQRTAGRFDAVEARGEAPPASVAPGTAGDRFRAPAERLPEVESRRGGAQPFVRCARCETDNTIYTAICFNCQADLGTPEQRAFNERLWALRQDQAAQEEKLLAQHREEQERAEAEETRARRKLAEEMAREVGDLERARLDRSLGDGYGWRWGELWGGQALGFRLLNRIGDPRLRLAVIGGLVAAPALLGLAVSPRYGLALFVVELSFFLRPNARLGRWL